MSAQVTTAPLAQRQRDILAAAALREAAASYPEGSRPAKGYWALSDLLEAELGLCDEAEIAEAMECVIALSEK